MAETYTLKAQPRDQVGKQVKRLRAEGRIPAVLYGHKVEPQKLSVARGDFEKVYRQAGGSSIITVELPDGQTNALIHEAQEQPVTGHYLHVDFYQVRMDEKIKATVPLEFEGTAPAVRELDGVLLTNLTEVEVECLPGDLPSQLTVNIEKLAGFEDAITVADLSVPSGVEITNEAETNVAAVMPPRTEAELEELETPAEPDLDAVAEEGEGEEGDGEEGAEGEGGDGDETAEGGSQDEKSDKGEKPDKSEG